MRQRASTLPASLAVLLDRLAYLDRLPEHTSQIKAGELAEDTTLDPLTRSLAASAVENAESDAVEIMKTIELLQDQLEGMAYYRPPLQYSEVVKDGNILDRKIREEICRFMNGYDTINVPDLEDEEGNHDIERWERLDTGSTRYEVREVPNDEIADPDEMTDEEKELPNEFIIWDTEQDYEVDRFPDEDDANTECEQMNREAGNEDLAGFPFAQNTGFIIARYEVEAFDQAGFCVYDYDSGDRIIAGIDGGGYDFLSAHWAPLWWARSQKYGCTVETEKGPRRIAKASDSGESNG